MSRGRPRRGATFSIRKVERRDDENSEETGADPESTDPVCPSVVDFATRFPRSVLPFFRSFVLSFFRSFLLPFFRSRQTRRATAKHHRLPTIFSRTYFALAGNCYEATNQRRKKRERERNNRDVGITATIVVLALGTCTDPAMRRFYPRSLRRLQEPCEADKATKRRSLEILLRISISMG